MWQMKPCRLVFGFTLCCVTLSGCASNKLEKEFFFNHPAATRVERLRHYSLENQYQIYRYGSDKFHPPLIELARPIAERGQQAVPFLLAKLKPPVDDVTVRDILEIFETMQSIDAYNVRSDGKVMGVLRARVAAMNAPDWQKVCEEMLHRIESPGP